MENQSVGGQCPIAQVTDNQKNKTACKRFFFLIKKSSVLMWTYSYSKASAGSKNQRNSRFSPCDRFVVSCRYLKQTIKYNNSKANFWILYLISSIPYNRLWRWGRCKSICAPQQRKSWILPCFQEFRPYLKTYPTVS